MSDEFDFDLDDDMEDLDFDDFDVDMDSPVNDERSPAGKVVTAAMDSILSENSARVAYHAVKDNALPRGYVTALDEVDKAVDFGNDVIDNVTKDLKPAKEAIQSSIRNNTETIEKVLPKWASSKIVSMGGYERDQEAEIDPREASIAASLESIFDRGKTDEANDQLDTADRNLEVAKIKTSAATSSSMASSLARLAEYQDTIGIDYQRKSLDLQHRHFFMTKDLLDVTKVTANTQNKFLESIQHNSSLPDIVKTRNSEEFAYMAQQNAFGRVQEGLHDYLSRATGEFRENLMGKARGWAGSLNNGVLQGLGLAEQMSLSQEQMSDMGVGTEDMVGGIAGDSLASSAAAITSRMLGDRLKVQNTDAQLEALIDQITQGREATKKQRDLIRDRLKASYESGEVVTLDMFRNMQFDKREDKEAFDALVGKDRGLLGRRDKKFDKKHEQFLKSNKDGTGNKFSGFGERIQDLFENKDAMLNEWAKGERSVSSLLNEKFNMDTDGIPSVAMKAVERFMRQMMPTWEEDYSVESRLSKDANDATTTTLLMQRSVTDIIPGYLSRMLQQLTVIATGDPDTPRMEYSIGREMTVEQSVKDADALNRILPKDRIDRRLKDSGDLIGELFSGVEITDQQRKQLADRVLRMRDRGEAFSLDKLAETRHERETEHGGRELQELIQKSKLNYNDQRRVGYSRSFGQIDNMSDHLTQELSRSTSLGERDSLYRLGLMDVETNKIDKNKLLDYMDGTRQRDEVGSLAEKGDIGQARRTTPTESTTPSTKDSKFKGYPNKKEAQAYLDRSRVQKAKKTSTASESISSDWIGNLRDHLTEGDSVYRGIPVYLTGGSLGDSDKTVELGEASLGRIETALSEASVRETVEAIHSPSMAERAMTDVSERWDRFSFKETAEKARTSLADRYNHFKDNQEAYRVKAREMTTKALSDMEAGLESLKETAPERYKELRERAEGLYATAKDKGEDAYLEGLYKWDALQDKAAEGLADGKAKASELKDDAYIRAMMALDTVRDKGEEGYLHALYGKDVITDKFNQAKQAATDTFSDITESNLPSVEKLKAMPDEMIARIPNNALRERVEGIRDNLVSSGSSTSERVKKAAEEAWADLTSTLHQFKDQVTQFATPEYALPGGGTMGPPPEENVVPSYRADPQMDRLIDINDKGFSTLSQLLNAMSIGAAGYVTVGPLGDMLASTKDGIGKIFNGLTSTVGSYYQGLGKVAGDVYSGGKTVVTKTWDWATGSSVLSDVYVNGRPGVVLSARLMKGENYFDQNTGNTIHHLDDISGPVVDAEGNVVLSMEDIEAGLVDRKGKAYGKMDSLRQKAWGAVKSAWGLQSNLVGTALSLPMNLYQNVSDKISALRNAYIPGEKTPRLLATVMRNGGYFSGVTGEPVTSWDQIDGPIVDLNGEVLVTMEELQAGLVDRLGVKIETKSVLGYAAGLYGKALSKGWSMAKSYLSTVKDVTVGSFNWVTDKLGDGYRKFKGELPKDAEFLKTLYYRLKEEGLSLSDFSSIEELKGMFPDLDWKNFKGRTLSAVGEGWQKLKAGASSMADGLGGGVSIGTGQLLPVQLEQLAVQRSIYEYLTGVEWDKTGTRDLEQRYAKIILPETQDEVPDDESSAEKEDRKNTTALLKAYRADLKTDTSSEDVPDREEEDDKQVTKAKDKSSNMLDMILGLGGKIIGGLGSLGGTIVSAIGGLASILAGKKVLGSLGGGGGVDVDLPDGPDGKRRSPKAKPKGFMGKAWGLAKKAGGLALGATRGGGKALMWAGRGALALTSVVSWPVLAGGVAVAGLGYAAYKGYQYLNLNRDVGVLEALRLMQAGVDISDSDFVVNVRKVEAKFLDDIEWSGNQPKFTGEVSEYAHEFADDMGMDSTLADDLVQWATWFTKRFAPVMLVHLATAKQFGLDMEDLDDDLEKDRIPEYVKACRITQDDRNAGLDPYAWTASPMGDRVVRSMLEEVTRYEDKLIEQYTNGKTVKVGYAAELSTAVAAKQTLEKAKGTTADLTAGLKETSVKTGTDPKSEKSWYEKVGSAVWGAATLPVTGLVSAYQGAKQFFAKSELNETPIGDYEALRQMQYGVQQGRDQLANQVRRLEVACADDTIVSGDMVQLANGPEYYFRKVGVGMGLDLNSAKHMEAWNVWFTYRFRPIFLAHVNWAQEKASGVKLYMLEKILMGKLAVQYVEDTRYTQIAGPGEPNPIDVVTFPMADEILVTNEATIETYRRKLLNLLGAQPSKVEEPVTEIPISKGENTKAVPSSAQALAPTPGPKEKTTSIPPTASTQNTVGGYSEQRRQTQTYTASRYNPATQQAAARTVERYAPGPQKVDIKAYSDGKIVRIKDLRGRGYLVDVLDTEGNHATYSGISELEDWVIDGAEVTEGRKLGTKTAKGTTTNSFTGKGSSIHNDGRTTAKSLMRKNQAVPSPSLATSRPAERQMKDSRPSSPSQTTEQDVSTLKAMERHHSEAQALRKEMLEAIKGVRDEVKGLTGSLDESVKKAEKSVTSSTSGSTATPTPTPKRNPTSRNQQDGSSLKRDNKMFDNSY